MAHEPGRAFEPRRFRSTVPYYPRYRLAYPDSLIARVIAMLGMHASDRVMDLGSGPGFLAIPFARAGMRVLAVDPEPEMLAAAGESASEAGVAIELFQGSSFELPKDVGPFRLVTMGRSFHWMNGAATIAALDHVVGPDGALAFFEDDHPHTAENAWRVALRDIANRFGREKSTHLVEARRAGFRSHHALLLDSPFCRLEGVSVVVRRQLTADEVVGLAFSLSTTSRERLAERASEFESELRKKMYELSPEGQFTEIAELSALIASRIV